MDVRGNQSFTNVLSQDTKSQKKLFHIFNTPQGFIGEICYNHLTRVKCSCEHKNTVGRVRELTDYYEKSIFDKSMDPTTETLYKLNPSVLERIKDYEKKLV